MRRWFNTSPLFEAAPAAGGGSDTFQSGDPGAPFEHDREPEPKVETKTATKSAETIELENLREENKRLATERQNALDDARFWANRNKRDPAEVEDLPQRREAEPPARPAVKPEKLLDDLTAEGIEGARKNGIITQEDLRAALTESEQRIAGTIQATRADAEFSMRLANDFPEIARESAKMDKDKSYRSADPVFIEASRIYREMVDLDPSLQGTNGLLLIAAKQAKANLAGKGKSEPVNTRQDDDDDRQVSRRRRIRAQGNERPISGAEGDEGHRNGFSSTQTEVMKRLGVSGEEFQRHSGGSGRGR